MLENEETTFEGEYFTVTNARNEPKGPQTPRPPIVIGGKGERRTLRTVARFADHWNVAPIDVHEWSDKMTVLAKHCAAVGRDPDEIMTSMMVRFNPDDLDGLTAELRRLGDLGLDGAIINLPSPHDVSHVDMVTKVISTL